MTYKVKLELPVLNVWHIGDSKQEFDIQIHFIEGRFFTFFVQVCGLESTGHPSLTEKKKKKKACHVKMLFN